MDKKWCKQTPFANVQLPRDQIKSIRINNQVLLATDNKNNALRNKLMHLTYNTHLLPQRDLSMCANFQSPTATINQRVLKCKPKENCGGNVCISF